MRFDAIHLGVVVAGSDHKGTWVRPHALVLSERDVDAFDTAGSAALAEDFDLVAVTELNNALVDFAKHRLVLRALQVVVSQGDDSTSGFRSRRGVHNKPPVDKEAAGLERMLRACRKTVEDVRAGNANVQEDALPALERLCAELEKRLTRLLSQRGQLS